MQTNEAPLDSLPRSRHTVDGYGEWGEIVEDAAEIAELMQRFAGRELEGWVRLDQQVERVRVTQVDLIQRSVTWDARVGVTLEGGVAEFFWMNVVYHVPLGSWSSDGRGPMPDWVCRIARRRYRRVAAPSGLSVRCDLPGRDALGECPVLDLSRAGMSFRAPSVLESIRPGSELPLIVSDPSGERGRLRAMVRNLRPEHAGRGAVVGLSFQAPGRGDERAPRGWLDAVLYPQTTQAVADPWELHEASGYLELSGKKPAEFAPVREAHARCVQKLACAPDIAAVVCWPQAGEPQATLSHYKLYQSTWFLCHVSKRRGLSAEGARRGLHDLYFRAFEVAQADPEGRWLMSYIQDAAPAFSRQVHIGVAERYLKTGEGCLLPFRAFEVRVEPRPRFDTPSPVSVRSPGMSMAQQTIRDLCLVRPAQYLDALDLTEERWNLAEAKANWQQADLERERQLLVAWQGHVRVALAVLETAEPHAHLYGLLDSLRLYPLRPGGQRAFPSLLAAAHEWFAGRGRSQFIYYREFVDGLSPSQLGFRDLGGVTLTLLATERVPELMQRVADMTIAQSRPGHAPLPAVAQKLSV